MKKIGLLIMIALLLFTLVACASAAKVSDTQDNVDLQEAVRAYVSENAAQLLPELPEQIDVRLTNVSEEETGYTVCGSVSCVFHRFDPIRNSFRMSCRKDESSGGFLIETMDFTPDSATAIEFPGLNFRTDPSRTLSFSIFGKEIYYYGLIIAAGFVLAILYARIRCKEFGLSFDSITDAIIFAVPLAIICARLYYVAFSWDDYKGDFLSIFKIWEGGIAIYGGVIGAALGLLLFSKVRKKRIAPYLDIMGLGLLIGQLIGRWGNFFNREAHGAETGKNFLLRMYMYSSQNHAFGSWHPTFLYESLWNLLGFIFLHFLSKKRKYDGQVFLMYVAWYGLGRLWIEGLRTDSLLIGPIRVSQLLAGLSFFAAIGIMVWIKIKKKPDGSGLEVRKQMKTSSAEPESAES